MENNSVKGLVTLDATNTRVLFVSTKNNLVVHYNKEYEHQTIIMHKKYFNRIHSHGSVVGRICSSEDSGILWNSEYKLFEGFSFK